MSRKEDINNPAYWRLRLKRAPSDALHQSIFICPTDRWERIEAKHRIVLNRLMGPNDSVLDAGCGYGRLLTLMPEKWHGRYLGIDISPDFIELARQKHPGCEFVVGDLRDTKQPTSGFDWAVLISIREMVKRNLGGNEWDKMEVELHRVAKKLLYLEYDEDNPESEDTYSSIE